MKITVLSLFITLTSIIYAQSAKDYAVLLRAEVQVIPPKITLKWPKENVLSYTVFRKLKSENGFATILATLTGLDSQYVDVSVVPAVSYEYLVRKNAAGYQGYGYINAGMEVPAMDVKGKLILLVDSSQALPLDMEISRLMDDLDGDGWAVRRMEIPASMKPFEVRNLIIDEFSMDPINTKAVFILGHVPVPYSGNLAPDGHANHVGAWPCDGYYGEMNSGWGDNTVNVTTAAEVRNHNIPGDGKFDNTVLPSNVELQVGRVDFADMPAFAKSETALLRQYLDKDHAFRIKEITALPRALIDDNFGGFGGEAFASSGWKAFSAMFGPDSIEEGDYFNTLKTGSYLWSYGCGGGTHTGAGGIGNTGNFAADSLQTVFTMLFGSYFGDWDHQNNFLRAPLAQGITLTNVWSGRPYWHFHHMALGETIGYSMALAMNDMSYFTNYAASYVHIALMGDPTLKMYIVAPPSGLTMTESDAHVDLSWTGSPEAVFGYNIYRKEAKEDLYVKLNAATIAGTAYTDTEFDHPGPYYYSVRAVKLETSASGTFYNLSKGVNGSITTIHTAIGTKERWAEAQIFPNPSDGNFNMVFKNFQPGIYDIAIHSIDGRQVVYKKLLIDSADQLIAMNYSNLYPGVYVLQLTGNGDARTERLIISR